MSKEKETTKETEQINKDEHERRVPKIISEREGEPLTTRERPHAETKKRATQPLVIAKKYRIKLLYGAAYSGPGEYQKPTANNIDKENFEKDLRDKGNFTADVIKTMSEMLFPTKIRRGRWYFEYKGALKETEDRDLAEIYRRKMVEYSKEKVVDGYKSLDITGPRVNRFSVIPIEVIQE